MPVYHERVRNQYLRYKPSVLVKPITPEQLRKEAANRGMTVQAFIGRVLDSVAQTGSFKKGSTA